MREICSYGSVGERGGNEPLYPEKKRARNMLKSDEFAVDLFKSDGLQYFIKQSIAYLIAE